MEVKKEVEMLSLSHKTVIKLLIFILTLQKKALFLK